MSQVFSLPSLYFNLAFTLSGCFITNLVDVSLFKIRWLYSVLQRLKLHLHSTTGYGDDEILLCNTNQLYKNKVIKDAAVLIYGLVTVENDDADFLVVQCF